jgi:hypothetical protein
MRSLVYTRVPPTEGGWYCCRCDGDGPVFSVEFLMRPSGSTTPLITDFRDPGHSYDSIEEMYDEWAGPIKPAEPSHAADLARSGEEGRP